MYVVPGQLGSPIINGAETVTLEDSNSPQLGPPFIKTKGASVSIMISSGQETPNPGTQSIVTF